MIVRLAVVAGVVLAVAVLSLWWRRREGRFAEAEGDFAPDELGLARGERPSAVLVEFWGENCAPCRTVETRLAKIAGEIPDVRVVGIDAGNRLDIANRHEVRRVPTVFVTDGDLRIVWRASGVPSEDSIRQVLLGPDWAGRPHPQGAPKRQRVFARRR